MGAVAQPKTLLAMAVGVGQGEGAYADGHCLERGYWFVRRSFAVKRRNYVVFAGQRQQHTQATSLPGDGPPSRGRNFLRIAGAGSHAHASAQGELLYRGS